MTGPIPRFGPSPAFIFTSTLQTRQTNFVRGSPGGSSDAKLARFCEGVERLSELGLDGVVGIHGQGEVALRMRKFVGSMEEEVTNCTQAAK